MSFGSLRICTFFRFVSLRSPWLMGLLLAVALPAGACAPGETDMGADDQAAEGGSGGQAPDDEQQDDEEEQPDRSNDDAAPASPPPREDAARLPLDARPRPGSDAGKPDAEAPPDNAGGAPGGAGLKPALMAAGYGGLRLVSFDDGKTWKNRSVEDVEGGDDNNLIRAVKYVDGMWVAVGWRVFLSSDGVKWTQVGPQELPGGWYDCVTTQNGRLIVKNVRSGQDGEASYSDDRGKTWQRATFATQCTASPKTYEGSGFALRSQWKGKLQRSTNGSTWQLVHQDCCDVVSFSVGMAAEAP